MSCTLVWSGRAFSDFGELFLELNGKGLVERGSIAASEWKSFLARSGRPEQEELFAQVHREITEASDGGRVATQVGFCEDGIVVVNPHSKVSTRKIAPAITVVRSSGDFSLSSVLLVRSEKEFPSDVENIWSFAEQQQFPADSKIFLNEPNFAVYLVGTFLWYPARVDVDPHHGLIINDETFDASFENSSQLHGRDLAVLAQELRGLGYTHLIIRSAGALKALDLRKTEPGDSP